MDDEFEYPSTGFVLPEHAEFSATGLVEFAEDVDQAGFDSVWCSEEWGYSAFSILSRIAEHVTCPLGTCVVGGFTRTPATIAANALALDEATDGRFLLGVGTGTPEMVEDFHGVPFDRPLRRLREIFEIVDQGLAGERLDYEGTTFSPTRFPLNHAPARSVPILNAAVGTQNIAMSIEYADGIMPHLIPFSAIDAVIAAAEDRAGRPSDLTVLPVVPTCVSEDERAATSLVAEYIAYCLSSTHVFADVLSQNGYREEVSSIRDRWGEEDYDGATEAVTADLLEAVALVGTPERARDRLDDLTGQFESVLLTCPHGISTAQARTTVAAFAD